MANNDIDVPRCPVCGAFMQKDREGRTLVVYECHGEVRTKPKPEWQSDPRLQGVR